MTDRIIKALAKCSKKDLQKIESIFIALQKGEVKNLDIKKLKNSPLYRIRSGRYRIILSKNGNTFSVVDVRKRDDRTYS